MWWKAGLMVLILAWSTSLPARADNVVVLEVVLPGHSWWWVELHGTGAISVEAVVPKGDGHGEMVYLKRYMADGSPAGGISSTHAEEDVWIHAQAVVLDHYVEGPRSSVGGAGASTGWDEDHDGQRVLVVAPTKGPLRIKATRESGDAFATLGAGGAGTYYSTGSDFDAPVQVVSSAGVLGRAMVEATWSFRVDSTLVGLFGTADIPDVGHRSGRLVGPAGTLECPCIVSEVRPGLALPPGDYTYIETSASVGAFASPMVFGADVIPPPGWST